MSSDEKGCSNNSPPVHKRRHHKKTRTGCITCKIRRVKCDEQKPFCKRCTSTGRKCDGYEQPAALIRQDEAPQLVFHVPQSPPRPLPTNRTPLEFRSLEFFQYRTMTILCGFQDPGAWTKLLLQVSATEPAIKHAMVALSAFHERCENLGIPLLEDESGLNHPSSSDAFALQQYTKAIHLLRQRLTYGQRNNTVTLLSCALFVCLEFLRGNKASAITHLRSGLEIIRSQLPSKAPSNHLEENKTPPDVVEGSLVPLFARLSILQSLYGQPRYSGYGPTGTGPFLEMLDMDLGPEQLLFDNLNEARIAGVNLCNSTLRLAFLIDFEHFPNDEAMYATQAALLGQCDDWCNALDLLITTLTPSAIPFAKLLAAHVYICRIWASSATERTQCAWDKHISLFEKIHDNCLPIIEHLETTNAKKPSFSLDAGLLSTLFFASIKCRHRFFRRKLIDLMGRAPHREGLWKAAEVTKVAEKLAAVEEEPIKDDLDCLYPPEESRVHDIDIQQRTAYDPGRQVVRLKMKTNGLDQDFVWRTEHIKW